MARRKKKPKWVVVLSTIIVIAIVLGYYYYNNVYLPNKYKDLYGKEIEYAHADNEITFHFPMLGNADNGDCTYVKVGDIDILIDAGSTGGSVPIIKSYVDKYCTDNTLEYVIVTHAHADHYAGFTVKNNIFDYYDCEIIIDFPKTNKTATSPDTDYAKYLANVEEEVANGATHYTALECVKEQNGAKKMYSLADNITMEILDQKYYKENSIEKNDENDYSVCVMFKHADRKFLFTGDLEATGESSLVDSNDLGEVALYKAGHHGSSTSSSDKLLNEIKPKICVVPCVAGVDEHTDNQSGTFPAQEFIDRIAKYTDKVYVPTLGEESMMKEGAEYTAMNGNIKVVSKDTKVSVLCSNSVELLRETKWFKNNRTMPSAWNFS